MAERPLDDLRTRVGRLYDTHGASLYRYAVMLLADATAAEDAVQQVFSALLRPSADGVSIEDAAHYLRRAVRNECYSILRRRRTRDGAESAAQMLEEIPEPEARAYGAADGVGPDERLALEHALCALPAEQREAVHLHVFEGLTFQEIADASNESINTVASPMGSQDSARPRCRPARADSLMFTRR